MEARKRAGRQETASRKLLSVWPKTARTLPKMYGLRNGAQEGFPVAKSQRLTVLMRGFE
jgi:hypothetical protein